MNVLDAIAARRSVRKFKYINSISHEEIDIIIKAGTYAPSVENQQPWIFYVITSQEKKEKFGNLIKEYFITNKILPSKIVEKFPYLLVSEIKKMGAIIIVYMSMEKWMTYSVYSSKVDYGKNINFREFIKAGEESYPTFLQKVTRKDGPKTFQEFIINLVNKVQSIGACIENMCLAATELGYDTIWLTMIGPLMGKIDEFLGIDVLKRDQVFMAMVGIGKRESNPPMRSRVDLSTIRFFI